MGTGGLYFTAAGQIGKASGEALKEDNAESRLIADNTLTLLSGGDASLKGAIATAHRIEADIAGKLTLSSLQDSERYKYKSSSAGGSLTISQAAPPAASLTGGMQTLNNRFQSVVEQTGLFAGEGGFNIKAGGHTQLNGAVIASSATPDKNRLSTRTLDFIDLTNFEQTQTGGYTFGLSTAPGGTFVTPVPNLSVNRTSVTQSLIAPGTVEVRGQQAQVNAKQAEHLSLTAQVQSLTAQLPTLKTRRDALESVPNSLAWYLAYYRNEQEKARLSNPGMVEFWGYFVKYIMDALPPDQRAIYDQYAQTQSQLAAAQTAQTASLDAIIKLNTQLPTLQGRTLATANPALANTFNKDKTRAQLEAMSVFAETAMRIVGDVYQKYDKAESDAERALRRARGTSGEAAAQSALDAAPAAKKAIETERALAHGLVGALTAAIGGASPVNGFIGGTAGKLATTELDRLLADSNWAKTNPIASNLLKTLTATAVGSITGGTTGGFVASNGDRFNRQLHPKIQAYLTKRSTVEAYLAAQRQAGRVLEYGQAQDELFTAGAVLNDQTAALILDSSALNAAKAWLRANDVIDKDIGTFFNLDPASKAYADFNLYSVEALSGGGRKNYEHYLAVHDPALVKAYEQRKGEVAGVIKAAREFWDGITQYPDKIAAAKKQIEQLVNSDPQQVWAAVKSAAKSLPEEARANFDKQMAEYTLRTIFGQHDKAAEIYTAAIVGMFDPGKKGAAVFDTLGKAVKELDVIKAAAKAPGKPNVPPAVMGKTPDGRPVYNADVGQKGKWDRAVNGDLEPNAQYRLSNGHTYDTDASGRVYAVAAPNLTATATDRNGHQQVCAGGECRQAGDQGGHLVAAALGGTGDRINLVAQSSVLNRGDYKAMENELRAAVKAGQTVTVKIEVGYPAGGVRPSEFRIVATIDGVTKPYRFTQ